TYILTRATKCRRFMPGLLALVSARESSEESLKPTAVPAYTPSRDTPARSDECLTPHSIWWCLCVCVCVCVFVCVEMEAEGVCVWVCVCGCRGCGCHYVAGVCECGCVSVCVAGY